MVRKTIKIAVMALVAAFALSSMAEAAAPPKRPLRHRVKHSSRVASGASTPAAKKPAAKKKPAAPARSRAQASRSTASTVQTAPATKAPVARRPTTKPH